MGNEYITMNIHICGLDINDKEFYESQMKSLRILFPEVDKNKSTSDYIVRYSKKPKWKAFIYSDNNSQNFELINQTIQTQLNKYNENNKNNKKKKMTIEEKGEIQNHMILLFVSDNHSDSLLCQEFSKEETIDALTDNFPLILFIFKNVDRDNLYYKDIFFDFSYIRCLNLSSFKFKENKENSKKEDFQALFLKSYLYNNYDSYFTERGHKIIDEIDLISNRQMPGIYLPIILVGSPGVGKSTFINIINGERISKASDSDEPVTSKSAFYDVKIPGKENSEIQMDNEELKQEAFIRFIDTPGFDLKKDVDIALKEIQRIFNDFKEGKEKVPVILYFMNPVGRNMTRDEGKEGKILEILKLIQKNKAKIIFVITHIPKNERWKKKSSFIRLLKEKNLEDLIEKNESNIIKCELVGINAYGIKEIIKKIYTYLNIIEDDNYKQTGEVYTHSLIEEIKNIPTFDKKLKHIKSKTSLFDHFNTKEDIISYGNKKSKLLMASMMVSAAAAGAIPIPFVDIAFVLSIIGGSLVRIGKYYGYVWKKISKEDLKAIYKGQLYNKNSNHKNNDVNNRINSEKEILEFFGGILLKATGIVIALNIDDFLKAFWGIGTIIGMIIGTAADIGLVYKYLYNAKKYFESKCKADDGTIFFCTRCAEYEVIFRKFKQFDNFDLVYPLQ